MGAIPVMITNNLLRAEFWSNFQFENRVKTYLELASIGVLSYTFVILQYYGIWTYLGYSQPLPMSLQLGGTVATVFINIALWSR